MAVNGHWPRRRQWAEYVRTQQCQRRQEPAYRGQLATGSGAYVRLPVASGLPPGSGVAR